MHQKKACFFSTSSKEQIKKEQYSLLDIRILNDLGYDVTIASKLSEIPWNCDLYFSWWASGSIFPFLVSFFARKPIIVIAGGNEAMFYRDSISQRPKGYLSTPWYKKIATKITLKFSSRILIVSEFMRTDVMKLGARNPKLIYNSVNTEKFAPADLERTEITTVIKLDRDVMELKRGYLLLQAIPKVVEKYPEQIFTFIGGKGNAFDECNAICNELGVFKNVQFINNIPNEEVVKWMQRSKLYIQISDTETFGVAIAEAMSCETPVVVSKRGAIPEVVGDLGIYVDHNNPADIASGIITILEMKNEDRKNLGKNLRKRIVENYSYERRKNEIEKVIDSVIN
jgi:glycosyltransferase involved in cell wall biosynthesis